MFFLVKKKDIGLLDVIFFLICMPIYILAFYLKLIWYSINFVIYSTFTFIFVILILLNE